MAAYFSRSLLLSWVFILAVSSKAAVTHNKTPAILSGSEYLDTEQKYHVTWDISTETETIYFEVTAETTGYVGFGISPSGGMMGADILIAGVNSDGTVYFSDRHGVGNMEPIVDTFPNWNVTSAVETETHTKLHFQRLLNTCDDEDIRITDGTMRIIWALGDTDTIRYHGANKGTKSVNFYLDDENEFDPTLYETFDLTPTSVMPAQHTAYWCTIHRAPLFNEKQHIVAIEPVLESLQAVQHTHHFVFYRCIAPDDQDPEEFFEPWVNHPGDFCYDQANASFPFAQYCNGNIVYIWSKGGKRLVFPPELGFPIPEKPGRREYYSLEVHYDNPSLLESVEFKTGGRIYYTPLLREVEVGLLLISQEVQVQLTVPPQETDFLVAGHCSGECTQEFLPDDDGITIFNNLFHAHLSGRELKLRHFRGEQELPWVDVDEYYDFDFQQNKPLTHYRQVLRGDQLTVECLYNSMGADGGGAVIGGLSTKDEMCEAILYYYPRQDFFYCSSGQDMDAHMSLLGITDYEIKNSSYAGGLPGVQILEPANLAGDYLESVSFKVNWTAEYRERFQKEKAFGEQVGVCDGGDRSFASNVKYPDNLQVYVPPDDCKL